MVTYFLENDRQCAANRERLGAIVALVEADDQFHQKCVATLKVLREPLVPVWPAVTETMLLTR